MKRLSDRSPSSRLNSHARNTVTRGHRVTNANKSSRAVVLGMLLCLGATACDEGRSVDYTSELAEDDTDSVQEAFEEELESTGNSEDKEPSLLGTASGAIFDTQDAGDIDRDDPNLFLAAVLYSQTGYGGKAYEVLVQKQASAVVWRWSDGQVNSIRLKPSCRLFAYSNSNLSGRYRTFPEDPDDTTGHLNNTALTMKSFKVACRDSRDYLGIAYGSTNRYTRHIPFWKSSSTIPDWWAYNLRTFSFNPKDFPQVGTAVLSVEVPTIQARAIVESWQDVRTYLPADVDFFEDQAVTIATECEPSTCYRQSTDCTSADGIGFQTIDSCINMGGRSYCTEEEVCVAVVGR